MRSLPLVPTLIAALALLTLSVFGLLAARDLTQGGYRGHATASIPFIVDADGSLVGLTLDDARCAEAPINFTIHAASGRAGLHNWRMATMRVLDIRTQKPGPSGHAIIERAAADPTFAAELEQMLRFAQTDQVASMILSNHPELPAKGHISQRSLHGPSALHAAAYAGPAMLAFAGAVWLIATLGRQYRVVRRPTPRPKPHSPAPGPTQ